jgi:hypothetical protein
MKHENDLLFITNKLKQDLYSLAREINSLKRMIESCKVGTEKLNLSRDYFNFGGYAKTAIKGFSNQLAQNITGVTPYDYSKSFGKMIANMFVPGRATGGNVSSGAPYVVGERGPEIFVPAGSGNIIPNSQLKSSSGNRQINLVMNVNAVDGESFRRSQSQIMAEAVQILHRASRNL